jgi:hypothetical protein
MYQFNDQITKSTRQFADAIANINRLAIENAEKNFGLQIAALEDSVNAAFSFANDLSEVRDADGLKAVWPKSVQVARTNAERTFGTAQEVFANTVKTNEAIAAIAKTQFEQASSQVKAEVEKATKAAAAKASK